MMKKAIICLVVFMNGLSLAAQISQEERFYSLCFITQGNRLGRFTTPTPTRKGNAVFQYLCKQYSFNATSDTINTLMKYWTTPICTYALGDNIKQFDTVHFVFYDFPDTSKIIRHHVLDLRRVYDKIISTTEESRLTSLIYILPFHSSFTYSRDTTELLLQVVPGLSPPETQMYLKTLTYLLYDYVYRKRLVPVVITFIDNHERRRHIIKPKNIDAEIRRRMAELHLKLN